jgi:hypothetical protein
LFFLLSIQALSLSQNPVGPLPPLHFPKVLIAAENFELVEVFDVNEDRMLETISGIFGTRGRIIASSTL